MNTKIVYVLVSTPDDVYLEQCFVSAVSARRHNPEARIVLVTDELTFRSLDDRGAEGTAFRNLFNEIIPVLLDGSLSAMKRSRMLKTSLRSIVKGDFLYIDTDTVIAGPLGAIDGFDAPLAACADLHCTFEVHPHRDASISLCRKIGFDPSAEEYYFNGGVMLVRESPEAEEFFNEWHRSYLDGFRKGVPQDQPSLARSNAACGHPVHLLPDIWNCQIQNGVRYLKDALVVHYVCTKIASGEEKRLYCLNDPSVFGSLKSVGTLDPALEEVVDDPFKGFAGLTQLFAGEDLYFFRTRRYRALRKGFRRGKFSMLEFLLKVRDHLFGRV